MPVPAGSSEPGWTTVGPLASVVAAGNPAGWTYTGAPFAQPWTSQSILDTIRFLIGDTDFNDQQLKDGEIGGLLAQAGSTTSAPGSVNIYAVAVQACRALTARYSRKANKTTGDLSIQAASIAKQYRDLAADLRREGMVNVIPVPYSGNIDLAGREADGEDDSMIQGNFSVGMDDDNGSTSDTASHGFSIVIPGA